MDLRDLRRTITADILLLLLDMAPVFIKILIGIDVCLDDQPSDRGVTSHGRLLVTSIGPLSPSPLQILTRCGFDLYHVNQYSQILAFMTVNLEEPPYYHRLYLGAFDSSTALMW